MPALKNARHEKFAQEIAAGKSAAQAYLSAGLRADRRSAWRVRHRSDVVRRIEELIQTEREQQKQAMAKAAAKYEVTAERVIGELARIAFANVSDYVRVGPDGELEADLRGCTRDETAALQEVAVEQFQRPGDDKARQGRRVKIKLADKRAALVDLARHLGLFVEPSPLNVNVANYFSERPPTLEEWKAEIEGQLPRPSIQK
jgi:phage terminase small subunit